MFATATRNFVEEVDRGGSLIPMSSLNDTIAILTLVIKKKRLFWQKPKYLTTDFTLNDILAGDTPINPDITVIDFIKYNGIYGGNLQANVEATFIQNNVNVEGKDKSKLQSSFGSLKKEELDVQKLLTASRERHLDMSHCLVEQTMMNHKQVFGIVKERIVTTQPCSVIEEVQKEGQCGGILTLCGPTVKKVSLKENASLCKDSNVTMEIPPQTTLAYALIELEVKHDGHFKLCLMSGTNGGFEEVDSPGPLDVSTATQFFEKIDFRQALEQLNDHFEAHAALPPQIKSSLLQKISDLIDDRAALASLENTLDHMCCNDRAVLDGSNKQEIQAILDVAAQSGEHQDTVIKAIHLTLSALEEMPDESLALLKTCCSPMLLPDLKLMGQCALESGELPLSAMKPASLSEKVYERIQHLFSSCKVLLKKDGDVFRTEIQQGAGNLPLILCIAVRGLTTFAQ